MPTLSLYEILFTVTERILLLLGWDRVKLSNYNFSEKREDGAYIELKRTNIKLRKRLKKSGVAEDAQSRPSQASWEKNTPQLRHITCATSTPIEPQPQHTWTSDTAFDASLTGTV